jgi:flagellar protein FliL
MARAQAAAEPGHGTTAASSPKSGKRKLVLTLGVLLVIAGGGAGAWYYSTAGTAADEAASRPERPPVFLQLEPFTVNLQPGRAHQYLQVGLSVKLANNSAADTIKLHMPEIRSRMLMLLSTKGSAELLTVEGKQQLAAELTAEVRRPLRDEAQARSVQSVVFTSFVIQ